MTSAANMIADLDAALLRAGTAATLRRYNDPENDDADRTEVSVTVSIRDMAASELAGDAAQETVHVVMSPSEAVAAAFSLPVVKGDALVAQSKEYRIEQVKDIYVGGTRVRTDLVCKG